MTDTRELTISTSTGTYQVRIGSGLANEVIRESDLVLIDRSVLSHLHDAGLLRLIQVEGGEELKTFSGCESLLGEMHRLRMRRGDRLIAIGGGSIQDAATFVASIYMRGIPWVYAPSTALAMLDSCIGGKSSINVAGVKNLVGSIYPPSEVVIDTALIASLNLEARVGGLAEAAKICFVRGVSEFDRFLELTPEPSDLGDDDATKDVIHHVLACKQWFIEIDEHDRAERQLLNFGHTYAHALESATDLAVSHGVAVAIGVLAAALHPDSAQDAVTSRLEEYCRGLLRPLADDIRRATSKFDWELFNRAVSSDKKGTRDHIRLVLPVTGGGTSLVDVPRSQDALAAIRASMDRALEAVTP